jgi:hypothetical protein
MLADLWGTENTIAVPNGNNCIADVGNGSGGIEGGGGDDDLAVPPPPPFASTSSYHQFPDAT